MRHLVLPVAILSLLMVQAFATNCTTYGKNDCLEDTTCTYDSTTGICSTASTTNYPSLAIGIVLTVFALLVGLYKFVSSYRRKKEEELKGIGSA